MLHGRSFLAPMTLVKFHWGHYKWGVKYRRGRSNLWFLTNISLYLKNSTDYDAHGYYGTLIETPIVICWTLNPTQSINVICWTVPFLMIWLRKTTYFVHFELPFLFLKCEAIDLKFGTQTDHSECLQPVCHWINRDKLKWNKDKTRNVGKCPTWWPPCWI